MARSNTNPKIPPLFAIVPRRYVRDRRSFILPPRLGITYTIYAVCWDYSPEPWGNWVHWLRPTTNGQRPSVSPETFFRSVLAVSRWPSSPTVAFAAAGFHPFGTGAHWFPETTTFNPPLRRRHATISTPGVPSTTKWLPSFESRRLRGSTKAPEFEQVVKVAVVELSCPDGFGTVETENIVFPDGTSNPVIMPRSEGPAGVEIRSVWARVGSTHAQMERQQRAHVQLGA